MGQSDKNQAKTKQTLDVIKELVNFDKKRKFTPHKLPSKHVTTFTKILSQLSKPFDTYYLSVEQSLDAKISNSNKLISFPNLQHDASIYVHQCTQRLVTLSEHLNPFGLVGQTAFQRVFQINQAPIFSPTRFYHQ